jgi:hypothetical protein
MKIFLFFGRNFPSENNNLAADEEEHFPTTQITLTSKSINQC